MKFCPECGEQIVLSANGTPICPQEHQLFGCGAVRPNRLTICQLPINHEGSHQATIYWEEE